MNCAFFIIFRTKNATLDHSPIATIETFHKTPRLNDKTTFLELTTFKKEKKIKKLIKKPIIIKAIQIGIEVKPLGIIPFSKCGK